MSPERKSLLRIKAEQGNPTDIVNWAITSSGTYYRGLRVAINFGEEVVAAYVEEYREAMNRRAAREPSTPKRLRIGFRGIEPLRNTDQRHISGANPPYNDGLRNAVYELFGKK